MIIYTTIWFFLYRGLGIKSLNKAVHEEKAIVLKQSLPIMSFYVLMSFIAGIGKEGKEWFTMPLSVMMIVDLAMLLRDLMEWWKNNLTNFTFTNIACLWLPIIKEPGR